MRMVDDAVHFRDCEVAASLMRLFAYLERCANFTCN